MNQQEMIRAIARRVQACGGRALLVGGCVRDALLGRESADIDCEVHGVAPDKLRALQDMERDMSVILARGVCKNVAR